MKEITDETPHAKAATDIENPQEPRLEIRETDSPDMQRRKAMEPANLVAHSTNIALALPDAVKALRRL